MGCSFVTTLLFCSLPDDGFNYDDDDDDDDSDDDDSDGDDSDDGFNYDDDGVPLQLSWGNKFSKLNRPFWQLLPASLKVTLDINF